VDGGIEGDAIWIHEDDHGREIQRGVHRGALPAVGERVGESDVDGRPWLVHELERAGGAVAVHLRKGGEPDRSRLARHHVTVPPAGTSF
jgi:hypothetical protein